MDTDMNGQTMTSHRRIRILKDKTKYGEPAWNVGLSYLLDKSFSAFVSVEKGFPIPDDRRIDSRLSCRPGEPRDETPDGI